MSGGRSVVKKDSSKEVVFDYHPKEFPVVISQSASEFMSQQNYQKSDFRISELVAQQSGINELQRKSLEDKIEAIALEKLKSIEEKAYKEAYELGLIEGTERAFEESRNEFQSRLNDIDALLKSIETLKQRLTTENEGALMKLIFQIAKRVAMREVEMNQDVIREILVQLIENLQTDERIIVRVSPQDLDFIDKLKGKIKGESDPLNRIKCEPNEEIRSGGCVIETNYGSIDATIEERVAKAWELLEARIPRVKGESNG